MTSDEVRGGLHHRRDIELLGDVPDAIDVERRRGAAVEDPVEIATADARETRMPVVRHRLELQHRDRVRA